MPESNWVLTIFLREMGHREQCSQELKLRQESRAVVWRAVKNDDRIGATCSRVGEAEIVEAAC